MSPPRLVSKNETPIRRSIPSGTRRLEIFPLRPRVITCGCSHSSRTSGIAPDLRAAATCRCSSHAALYSTRPRSMTSSSFIASVLSTLNCNLLALPRRDDPLDLFRMVHVVPGHHADDMLDGFDAPLGVHSVVLPLFGLKRFQQREVRFPRRTKLFQRFARVPFLVMARGGPGILVKRLNRRSRSAQDLPHPPAHHNFAIREMREDFRGRPFPRRGLFPKLRGRRTLDEPPQFFGRGCLDFQGRLSSEQPKHALDILLRCFLHRGVSPSPAITRQ